MTLRQKLLTHVGIVFILVLIAIPLSFVVMSFQCVICDQLDSLRLGNISEAYSYSSEEFRNETSLNEFSKFVNHYEALKNNASMKVIKSEMDGDDKKLIQMSLTAKDHSKMVVEYRLIKEHGSWKILGMEVTSQDEASSNEANNPPLSLKEYDNTDSKYKLSYPSSWVYEQPTRGTVIFSGKQNTPSYYSTVSIQTVLSKATGGDFSSVKEFMADIKKQSRAMSTESKLIEEGPITIKEADGTKDVGLYMIFTYKYKGETFKQWQIVIMRHDKQVFYAWAYTAPESLYDDYEKFAKAMLDSWVVY